jgi:hypothetical protein
MCGKELLWGGDHSYEDYLLEDEGIVTNYSCTDEDCSVETILIYSKI